MDFEQNQGMIKDYKPPVLGLGSCGFKPKAVSDLRITNI